MAKECYVVCRNSYGNTYPVRVFLSRGAAASYMETLVIVDSKARYYIDITTLEEI